MDTIPTITDAGSFALLAYVVVAFLRRVVPRMDRMIESQERLRRQMLALSLLVVERQGVDPKRAADVIAAAANNGKEGSP